MAFLIMPFSPFILHYLSHYFCNTSTFCACVEINPRTKSDAGGRPETRVSLRLETTPLLSGERDWQAAVLRVVPVREECHAATRM